MAIAFTSITKTSFHPAHASHPGLLTATIVTTSGSTYATNGFTLDLTKLFTGNDGLGTFSPSSIVAITLRTGEGYLAEWTPATSPTVASAGTVVLYASGATEVTNATAFATKTWYLTLHLQ